MLFLLILTCIFLTFSSLVPQLWWPCGLFHFPTSGTTATWSDLSYLEGQELSFLSHPFRCVDLASHNLRFYMYAVQGLGSKYPALQNIKRST